MPRNSFYCCRELQGSSLHVATRYLSEDVWRLRLRLHIFIFKCTHTIYIYIYIYLMYIDTIAIAIVITNMHIYCTYLTEISGRSFHTSQMLGESLMNAFWCCFRLWKLMQWPKQTANITPPYPQCISSWMRLRMPSTSQRFPTSK